jgi:UPF0716 protein FxsA
MFILWFLLFLSWPVAEIAIFVQVGQAIGWLGAILLTIGTAVAGSILLRIQGFNTMNRFLAAAEKGEAPVGPVLLDGMGIFVAGLLLLLPGFISDVLGLLLFIPPLRRWLIAMMFRNVLQGGATSWPRRSGPSRRTGDGSGGGFRKSENVVDAEFETLDPQGTKKEPGALPDKSGKGNSKSDPNSPWRNS